MSLDKYVHTVDDAMHKKRFQASNSFIGFAGYIFDWLKKWHKTTIIKPINTSCFQHSNEFF